MKRAAHPRTMAATAQNITPGTAATLVLVVGALWGTIGAAARGLLDAGYSPTSIITWRLLLAAVVGQVVLFANKRRFVKPKLPLLFFFHGLVASVLTMYLYFSAILHIGAALTVVLHYTWPSFAVLFGAIFFRERITAVKLISLLLTTAGIGAISFSGSLTGVNLSPVGILLAVLSGVTLAGGSIFIKHELQSADRLEVIVWPLSFAALLMTIYSWYQGDLLQGFGTAFNWGLVVYLALATTFLANSLQTIALRVLPVGSAAILATIEPVAGVILAQLLFAEEIITVQKFGLLLIISGVILVNKRRRV